MKNTRLSILVPLLFATGCATLVDSASQRFSDALSAGILGQTDEQIVRDGLPAYLLLIDGFIAENPQSEGLLLAGADLYGSYVGAFVIDAERARELTARARGYGERGLCVASERLCASFQGSFDPWLEALREADVDTIDALYGFAASWATWVQANADDWSAVADLPKVEAAMERVVEMAPEYRIGWPHIYLGVLKTQLPPAYGGKPEEGRVHFERAIELSGGRNLMARVLFAQRYARLVFDQALHDEQLAAVLAADVEAEGLTFTNVLARKRARQLLEESNEYF